MAVVLLVRHGRTTANVSGVLAGRAAGVGLDDAGVAQAQALASRLEPVVLARVVTSPLERCRQTVAPVAAGRECPVEVDDRVVEADYGEWTGEKLTRLARTTLWRTVQDHPSAAVFPGGEAMAAVQARAVAAVREHDRFVEQAHGADAVWLLASHGDVIKSVVADALGVHLDLFQRIVVDPASVSVIRYTTGRPFVLRTNDVSGSFDWLRPRPRRRRARRSDAAVGGGAGDS